MPLTKRAFLAGGICACCAGTLAPLFAATPAASVGDFGSDGLPDLLELGTEPMKRIGPTVWVRKIAPELWLHTTTAVIPGNYVFPANGLILERRGGSLLIDTTYTPGQAEVLVQWAKRELARPITLAIATHFHTDRTGGVEGLKKRGIRTLAYPLTCTLAAEHQMPVPEPIADFAAGAYRLDADCELFFPGAGHTRDNVVAWLPRQQVLLGGCFLKSVTSRDLGNVADAVVPDWAGSVRRAREHYPAARITIPGHGTIEGDPIARTVNLLAKSDVQATTSRP